MSHHCRLLMLFTIFTQNFTDTGSPRCDTIPNLRMQGCSEYTSPNSSYTIDLVNIY